MQTWQRAPIALNKVVFDIYLSCSKYKGWLNNKSDPADDEGKVEDLKEATSLLQEEAGEQGDKHLMEK